MMQKCRLFLGETTRTIVSAIIIATLFRSFLFDPFHIPSSSMRPLLAPGDKIFVNKFSYGYSQFSFPLHIIPIRHRFFDRYPSRGDVVVFALPSNTDTYYIKRIVGLPGDKVQVLDGDVIVNGHKAKYTKVEHKSVPTDDGRNMDVTEYLETNIDNKSYHVYIASRDSQPNNTKVYIVPTDHFFVMGDNRNYSADSRFQNVGFIPYDNLIGKASLIFYSSPEPFYKLISSISEMRWGKIGTLLTPKD